MMAGTKRALLLLLLLLYSGGHDRSLAFDSRRGTSDPGTLFSSKRQKERVRLLLREERTAMFSLRLYGLPGDYHSTVLLGTASSSSSAAFCACAARDEDINKCFHASHVRLR